MIRSLRSLVEVDQLKVPRPLHLLKKTLVSRISSLVHDVPLHSVSDTHANNPSILSAILCNVGI